MDGENTPLEPDENIVVLENHNTVVEILPLSNVISENVISEKSKKNKANVRLTDVMCPICARKLPGTGNLSFHMALHPVDRPQTCDYCVRVFRTKDELNQHVLENHEKPFLCDICGAKFSVSYRLKKHLLGHNAVKAHKCAYCGDGFRNYDNWRHHEIQHRGVTDFKCNLCHVGFWTEERFLEHVNARNCTEEVHCCNQVFQTRLEYVDHFMKKHRRWEHEEYACKHCQKLFPYVSTLTKHEENCIKGVLRNSLPRDPKNSHKKKKDTVPVPEPNQNGYYRCHVCETSTKSITGLKIHIARQHVPPEDDSMKKFQCTFCQKRFSTYGTLRIHKQIHIKKHGCSECGKRFAHNFLLRNHMYVHNKVKPFPCEHCEKSFTSRTQLNEHVNTHTGNRPYKCRYCDDRFKRRTAVRCHELIHTGERRFKCKICGLGFTQPSTCKQHERAHEKSGGKRKFCCKDCPAIFYSVTQLKAHKQAMHEEEEEEEDETDVANIQQVAEDGHHWTQGSDIATDAQGNVYLYV